MKTLSPLPLAASIALLGLVSACNIKPETIDPNKEEAEANKAPAGKVELPPMMLASHTYRCKDNSLVKVEFMSDKTATYFEGDSKDGKKLTQAPEGGAYAGDGISVSGPDAEITLTAPGKGTTTCKA